MSLPATSAPTRRSNRTARRSSPWVSGLLGLLAGSFAVNAVPHLFAGLGGNVFQTPFGAESSAAVNLAWGSANAALAVVLTWLARSRVRSTSFLAGAAAGVVGTGASLLVVLR